MTWVLLGLAGGAGAIARFVVDQRVSEWVSRRGPQHQPAHNPPAHSPQSPVDAPGAPPLTTPAAPTAPATPVGTPATPVGTPATPVGTIAVNVSACFLLGLLTGAVADDTVLLVVGTGLLGGYSTFSTACVEGARLLLAGRPGRAAAHTVGMVVGGLLAAVAGLMVGGSLV